MASQDTPHTTRDARLEVRVSAAQKGLLQHAAAMSGRTLSEFVVNSALDAARLVIAEHESIRLSREEQGAFVQALLQPPEAERAPEARGQGPSWSRLPTHRRLAGPRGQRWSAARVAIHCSRSDQRQAMARGPKCTGRGKAPFATNR